MPSTVKTSPQQAQKEMGVASSNLNAPEGQHSKEGASNDLLRLLETSLDNIRELITCRVCFRPLCEPYTNECGHTFCYGCLSHWFERDRTKKSCPECRAEVTRPPAPAYLVRDLTQVFANRAELLAEGETTEEHKKWQEEEAALVEKDRSTAGSKGGLFRGCFRRRISHEPFGYQFRGPIRDEEDGVERCPRCTWELEDGLCQSCGYPSGDDDLSSTDYEATEYFHTEDDYGYAEDDDDHMVLDALERGLNVDHHDSEYTINYSSDEGDIDQDRSLGSHVDEADSPGHGLPDSDEGTDVEDAGSLDDFVVEDARVIHQRLSGSVRNYFPESDDGAVVEDEHMEDSTGDGEFDSEEEHSEEDGMSRISSHPGQYDSLEESDQGPIPPSRRRRAPRTRAVDYFSSDEDEQQVIPHRGRAGHNFGGRRSRGALESQRNHPVEPNATRTAREGSQNAPIGIDSDSDAPISASQRTRNRRTHRVPPSSHIALEEPDGRLSAEEGTDGTATVGRFSSRSVSHSRHNDQPEDLNGNGPPSIIGSANPNRSPSDAEDERPHHHVSFSFGPELHLGRSGSPHFHDASDGPSWLPQRSPARQSINNNVSNNTSSRTRSSLSPSNSSRNRNIRRPSPLASRVPAQVHLAGAEEQLLQGVRERQARKAERKAERRRRKAEQERRRSNEATPSAA